MEEAEGVSSPVTVDEFLIELESGLKPAAGLERAQQVARDWLRLFAKNYPFVDFAWRSCGVPARMEDTAQTIQEVADGTAQEGHLRGSLHYLVNAFLDNWHELEDAKEAAKNTQAAAHKGVRVKKEDEGAATREKRPDDPPPPTQADTGGAQFSLFG